MTEENNFKEKAEVWNQQNEQTNWLLVKKRYYRFLQTFFIVIAFLIIAFIGTLFIISKNGYLRPEFNNTNNLNLTNFNDYDPVTNNNYDNDFNNDVVIQKNDTYNIYLDISEELIEKICNST